MNKQWAMHHGIIMGIISCASMVLLMMMNVRGENSGYLLGLISGFIGAWCIVSLKNKHRIYQLIVKKKRPIFIDLNQDLSQFLFIQTGFNLILVLLGVHWQLILFSLIGFVVAMLLHDHGKEANIVLGMAFWGFIEVSLAQIFSTAWVMILCLMCLIVYGIIVEYRYRHDWKIVMREGF